MNPILVYAFSAVGLIVVGAISWLSYSLIKRIKQVGTLKKQLQGSLTEDLELATSEQLMGELRRRPSQPYILLMPIKSQNHQGLSVEIHGVPPAMSVSVLRMATMVTTKELQERGVEIPEFDDMPPEFPGDVFNDN